MKNLCNENKLDALFILSLFCQSTSACSGHISSPSSGGILYIYNNWFSLHRYIEMHSQQNIKYIKTFATTGRY